MKIIGLICFLAIFSAVIGILVREQNPKFALFLGATASILFFTLAWQYISPVIRYFQSLIANTGQASLFEILLKALGIAVLISIVSELCRDLGENSLADKVDFCGKAVLFYLALPIFRQIFEIIGELLT